MKTLLVTLVLGLVTTTMAATYLEGVQKRAEKLTTPSGTPPKVLCICLATGAQNLRVGAPRFSPNPFTGGTIGCWLPSFDGAGNVLGESLCSNFTMLAK